MKRDNEAGFTLLELLVTLAIISIVMMIGVPSFQHAIRSNRLTAAINDLSTSLSMARSEAIKRNRHVVVRKTGANWENGWQVFVDNVRGTVATTGIFDGGTNACLATEDCLLKVQEALPNGFSLRTTIATGSFTDFVDYSAQGAISLASGSSTAAIDTSFYLCSPNVGNAVPAIGTARALTVNAIGRPGMAINNTTIPQIVAGTDITCTPA